jgi:hypothetical protein
VVLSALCYDKLYQLPMLEKFGHTPLVMRVTQIPFMNRVGYVFLVCLALAIIVSLLQPKSKAKATTVDLKEIDYSTSTSFNLASLVVIAILIALYAVFW